MFEFLFKYSPATFSKGKFVFLSPWPLWLLALAVLAAGAALFWHMRRNRGLLTGARPIAIWLLETALIALVLLMLWHPAISIATLRPQQNVVTVLLDDSRSMGIVEDGKSRLDAAKDLLTRDLSPSLSKKFQVRLYRFGKDLQRVDRPETQLASIAPDENATRIGESLNQAMSEASTLPLGAIVLMSDGADNSGGLDSDTIARIRQKRIPVHTIGFGREKLPKDIEITDVTLPARALADSRLNAQVQFRQYGYARGKARLSVRDGGKVLASQPIDLKGDGVVHSESLVFNAGAAGPRNLQIGIDPLPGEENKANNVLTRLVNVSARKPRILYIEGEPRWEYKFIRRAIEEDHSLELVSLLRTTQNKNYRQGIANAKELEEGFPAKAEELFAYDGLIVGSVEASYFTPSQQELIVQFANRRGGGVLFLAGRFGLADGGYSKSPVADMLPIRLFSAAYTFHRDYSTAELTQAGQDSLICRFEENRDKNMERWKKMPQIANYQVVGDAKPGAVTLMDVRPPGRGRSPLLVVQNYGRGRAAVLATAGTWRWQMQQEVADKTHEMFWQQLLRWLVSETPGQVASSTPHQVLSDETKIHMRVEARDKGFQPLGNARVEARVIGPGNLSETVALAPQPFEPGVYTTDWTAERPGSYLAEVVASNDKGEAGRDTLMFRREDGVAENFRTTQNKELLQRLSEQTGGRYYTAGNAKRLTDEISLSEAGITSHETRDLWDMPIVLLLALALRSGEWLLRRKWGVV